MSQIPDEKENERKLFLQNRAQQWKANLMDKFKELKQKVDEFEAKQSIPEPDLDEKTVKEHLRANRNSFIMTLRENKEYASFEEKYPTIFRGIVEGEYSDNYKLYQLAEMIDIRVKCIESPERKEELEEKYGIALAKRYLPNQINGKDIDYEKVVNDYKQNNSNNNSNNSDDAPIHLFD